MDGDRAAGYVTVIKDLSSLQHVEEEKAMLKAGMTATVEGYPNRDKPEEMRAERIIVNGKTIELR